MSVNITIQETINEVDITVNQNVITVNVTRTTGSGGVESVNGETGVVVLDIPTQTSDLTNDGENGVDPFITLKDIPGNLILYPTTASSDIGGYFKLVTDIEDADYNTTAVDVSTGAITTTNQLISSLASSAGVLIGNPGIVNITVVGNIKRVSGTGTATFNYEVYKRSSVGVETLVSTSGDTLPVSLGTYTEFFAISLLNDGSYLDTDRIVLKFYGDRVSGGSNPTYNFQFGGIMPVRAIFPVPSVNLPSPSLPNVLKIGDRVFQEVAGTAGVYTFEIDDRWKDTLINGATDLILDDDAGLFPINSVIPFHVYDVPALLNYTAGTDLRYLGAAASADILIEVGDDCRLKKIDLGIWELVVGNKSTGGSGTVTNVSGTTNEITVSSPTTTPVISISSTYTTARDAYADAKVADTINNGTTTIAPSQNAVFDALDFTRRLITKGTGSVTGTVSETIITTLTIPANTLDSSCFIWTTMDFFKTNFGTVTTRLYINNANTLTGATLLGFYVGGSYRNVSFNRKFLVTGTSLDLLTANTVSTQVTNEFIEALFGASTVLTINPSADIFLIYTTQNDATGTVATNKMATVQKMKL